MHQIKKNKILFIIVIVVVLFLIFFSIPKKASPTSKNFLTENKAISSAFLEINSLKYESDIPGPISIYAFMEKLKNEGKINFEEKNYVGMGKFIESINGIKNNGEKNWIYYVNGKKANIGISNYQIKEGDIVSWKQEKDY